ncbi:MAG: 50S ribosomal protein L23 [Candidatus Magasanikbacteria bacterium RIFOXYC2_FULL_39_8]|nr:MAG: 50S ribosomal protein L23 [Candidatus Magasanikbacteria bacterium RIFOXYC2_FULL_39_8]
MEMRGVYAFAVALEATKEDIKHAVFQTYGVKPTQVRTSHVEGKRVRFGYAKGKRRDWKKAMVYLPKGMTIHVHEGV